MQTAGDMRLEEVAQHLLEKHEIPGLSIAVIQHEEILTCVRGTLHEGSSRVVEATSRFQAASISKPVAALAALRLVDEGRLALDKDVNQFLHAWRVPNFDGKEHITLRQILSHSSGLSVHGFEGYPYGQGALPTIVEILEGQTPANSPSVETMWRAGTQAAYSGGGFCVLQLLVEEITGLAFDKALDELVLGPLEMRHSTYSLPTANTDVSQYASGHRGDGTIVEGNFHVYPEMAAAGLWTTPTDLAKFVIELQRGYKGQPGKVVSPAIIRDMLQPQGSVLFGDTPIGLGIMFEGEGTRTKFKHFGSNEGFRGAMIGYKEQPYGLVVMVNMDASPELVNELASEIESVLPIDDDGSRRRVF